MLLTTDIPNAPNLRLDWPAALELDVDVADILTEKIDDLIEGALGPRRRAARQAKARERGG